MKSAIFSLAASVGHRADPWVIVEGEQPISPSADPFYHYNQTSLDAYAPGSVLRWRPVGTANYSVSKGVQMLYRTADHDDNAQATVSTLLFPQNSTKNQLVVFEMAEDAVNIDCSPSYNALTQQADASIEELLDNGIMVSIPDYEGPKSAFGAGVSAGRRTLDSIRAIDVAKEILGLNQAPQTAIWGYSGGSIAASHAAEQQSSYAPDVDIAAVAVGGLVPNLTSTFYRVNGGPAAGFLPSAILGLASEYTTSTTNLSKIVDQSLKPHKKSDFFKARDWCSAENLELYSGQNILKYFKDGAGDLVLPEWQKVITSNALGYLTPKDIPLYIYQGTKDEITPISEINRLVGRYCHDGAHLLYNRVQDSDHLTTQRTHVQHAIDFISAAFNGVNVASSCRSNASTSNGYNSLEEGTEADASSSGCFLSPSRVLTAVSILLVMIV